MSENPHPSPSLSESELHRYRSQILLPEIGTEGQKKLKESSVLIIGAGGLGCPAALYLAGAGVGRIGLVDHDTVSLSNLHRQVLYSTQQVDSKKTTSAHELLKNLNPNIQIESHCIRVGSDNILELMRPYDVVLDGTDNFTAKYLINDACSALGKPLVFGAVQGFDAYVSVFHPPKGPCYRCLYPNPPSPKAVTGCSESGVLGSIAGITGTIQATEVLKLLLNLGTPLLGKVLMLDSLKMNFSSYRLQPRTGCPGCQPQISATKEEISAVELAEKLRNEGTKTFQLVDVRTDEEFHSGHIDGAIHLPLHELEDKIDQLDPNKEVVLYCHLGIRSKYALDFLRSEGFQKVSHLQKGIWSWEQTHTR